LAGFAGLADPALAKAVERWLDWLASERRASALTVEAYRDDVARFLAFTAQHHGEAPSAALLATLAPADFRAFLAARRGQGVANVSNARALSALRDPDPRAQAAAPRAEAAEPRRGRRGDRRG
jgi:integrase/recombinase XerC